MKKALVFHIVLLMTGAPLFGQQKWKIVSSASIFKDMVENVGKEKVVSKSIVPIGGDPHIYEPRPSDAALVQSADLIFINGLNFEGWIQELIENSGTRAKVVTITSGITPIASQTYQNAFDPHAWMDASYGKIYVINITQALIDLDQENTAFYRSNGDEYIKKLNELDAFIFSEIDKIPPEHRVLITSHDAFSYYGERYGIEVSPIMGISTDAEAQTSDISRVTKKIQSTGVPAVFIESTINPKLLKQIADDNNVKIGGELYSDSIGEPDSEANTYLNMLKYNTTVIVNALSSNKPTSTKIDKDDTSHNVYLYLFLGLLMVGSFIFLFIKAQKK